MTLTSEQVEKQNARRTKFKELAKQIAAMTDEQRDALAWSCVPHTIEGRALSHHNCCLIALQLPSATLVGGFRQWLNAGRCVRKGQHGLMIWVPMIRKTKDDATGERKPDDTRFITGTVFDVSQTDELPAVG